MTPDQSSSGPPRPPSPRPSPAERRAAQSELLSSRQAELKQEAADRRLARAEQDAASPPPTPTKRPARRRGR
jgi:hypothetical protein